jgi:poly-gamma-glutamate system protein
MASIRALGLREVIPICALLMGPGTAAGAWPRAVAPPPGDGVRAEAVRLMQRSLQSIGALRATRQLPIDRALDPNGTGLVGEEFTPLTTSLGEVEAKRTSANPAFASAMVGYFRAAGLSRGDAVAVGASGSFPGLIIATLCAAKALALDPIVIYSVGASMYGANLPGFTLVDMLEQLRADAVLPYRLAAVSPGGNDDLGDGVLLDERGDALRAEARRSGLPMVEGATLAERIRSRLRIYEAAAAGRPIRCFVNVGGAAANWGDTEASLLVPNGLVPRLAHVPSGPTRGLVFEFAARGVPVVHLLYVRGLAAANHIPFESRDARGARTPRPADRRLR